MTMKQIKVIGHRGAAGLEPENTLLAFKKALKLGVDELELDILPSKDGHLMVIHDDKIDRTTNGSGYVKNLTLSELKKLNAGKGEKIPTLNEVFDLIKNKNVILNIELKKSGYENKVVDLIKKYKFEKKVLVISFVADAIKKIAPVEFQ